MVNPARGDAVETWLKGVRDRIPPGDQWWYALDYALEDYRKHADYGHKLGDQLPEEWGMM